mgnify:CR=1 FL=1
MKKNKTYLFTHYVTYLTFIHGIGYWIYKYFLKVETEYGIRPHPLQEVWQASHVLLSPLLVFAFGLLFKGHIWKMYKNAHHKRKTGITLTLSMVIMILSGYLVQVIYQVEAKQITAYVHIAISVLFIFAYLIHHLFKR